MDEAETQWQTLYKIQVCQGIRLGICFSISQLEVRRKDTLFLRHQGSARVHEGLDKGAYMVHGLPVMVTQGGPLRVTSRVRDP